MFHLVLVAAFWPTVRGFGAGGVFAGLYGFILGIMVSLPINDIQEILGEKRKHLFGQYAGVAYTIASPFILGGVAFAGFLADTHGALSAGLFSAVTVAIGGVFLLMSSVLKDDTQDFDDIRRFSQKTTISEGETVAESTISDEKDSSSVKKNERQDSAGYSAA